jgi:hypothetical protein
VFVGASAAEAVNLNDMLHLRGRDGGNTILAFDGFNNGTQNMPKMMFRGSGGTQATPLAATTGTFLGGMTWRSGINTTQNANFGGDDSIRVIGVAAENQSSTTAGAHLAVFQVPVGSAPGVLTETARFMANGGFQLSNPVATNPVAGDFVGGSQNAVMVYVRSNKLVFAYNKAGVVQFLTLALDGAANTFAAVTTTAP